MKGNNKLPFREVKNMCFSKGNMINNKTLEK